MHKVNLKVKFNIDNGEVYIKKKYLYLYNIEWEIC